MPLELEAKILSDPDCNQKRSASCLLQVLESGYFLVPASLEEDRGDWWRGFGVVEALSSPLYSLLTVLI